MIVDRDPQYGAWLQHHVGASLPGATVRLIDVAEFERVRVALTRRDCDLVLLALAFGDSPEDPGSEGLDWLRRLREQPGFPVIIAIAETGNELTAVRALKLGASDYLPKHLLTPERLITAIKVSSRLIERRREPRAPVADAAQPPQRDGSSRGSAYAAVGRAFASAPAHAARNLIPRYTIVHTLGESDKAVVYLALSSELSRNVALKVSKEAQDPNDTHSRQQFAREYEAIAALHHPAVVDIYDYGVHDGREYLAMEYFPCGDLKARLQHPISESESVEYVRRIAAALQVVHEAGLVHRDLKPPNVMVRENGEIVLIDFGLARNVDDTRGSTRTGMLRGSPYYMSPEQAQGSALDRRTDLYSLGVIFFEMLTGKKPYTGTSAIEVLQQHVSGAVPILPPELSHHQWLLDRLLAKAREERFATAQEVLDAIAAQAHLATQDARLAAYL
jgi:eukaryotic-like serine/threonine-protein kinase